MTRRILLILWALTLATLTHAQSLTSNPFSATSLWNTRVPAGSVYHPLSWPAATGFNYSIAWDSFSPAVYTADPVVDPLVITTYTPSWGWFGPTASVHIPVGVTGAPGTDGELIVIDAGIVYNFYQFDRTSNTTATAGAFAQTPITSDGFGTPIPFLGAGTTAIGASELGGLINDFDETSSTITHAIGLSVDVPLALPGFISPPAIAGDGNSPSGIVTEGQKLAIPASTSMPAGLSPLGQKIFGAMRDYGVIVYDRAIGDSAFRAQANAFSAPVITALVTDVNTLIPLLESYTPGTVTRPPQMSLLGVGP